jgi:hypothetical protein
MANTGGVEQAEWSTEHAARERRDEAEVRVSD